MRKDHCEIVCILDRSGSMEEIRDDAIGGFNAFIEAQKAAPGSATCTLVLFDNEYSVVYQGKALKDVPALTGETFMPRGSTALLDAVGRTIDEVGKRLSELPQEDRPGKVLICILTDGQENSSYRYKKDKIKEMIEHQRSKYSWEFAFLAANQDAFAEASLMGIGQHMTQNFAATGVGVRCAYQHMSDMTLGYRNS